MYPEKQRPIVLAVLCCDIVAICLNSLLILFATDDYIQRMKMPFPRTTYLLAVFLLYLVIFFLKTSRSTIVSRGVLEEIRMVLSMNLYVLLIMVLFLFFTQQLLPIYRRIFTMQFVGDCVFMYTLRMLYKLYLLRGFRNSKRSKRLVVITTRDRAEEVLTNLKDNRLYDYKLHSVILWDGTKSDIGTSIAGVPVKAVQSNLLQYAKRTVMDEAFIKLPGDQNIDLYPVIDALEDMGAKVNVCIDVFDIRLKGHNQQLQQMGDYYVTAFYKREIPFMMAGAKRLIDIIGSLIGLAITGVVTIFLAPPLLIESPGPLVFSQVRVGKNGRRFKIYKFRSMYQDAEERKKELMAKNEMNGLMFKMQDDPRITKVGKFIRKTSLDELPQFWNVLKGDMSLIGTRPPTMDEFEKYKGRYKRRLSLRPGITGMWQVSGRSDIKDFEDVLALDLEYIDNWSLGLDFKILFKTIGVVLFRKGAK